MIVTELVRERRRRVAVYADDRFALTLSLNFAREKGIHVGMDVSTAEIETLRAEDERRVAYDTALHLLSYRPRSEREIRQRLRRRGVGPEVIDETVQRLLAVHYLDDAAFAQFWRESRENISPRSRRLVRAELLSKGVDAETATSSVEAMDDEESAYRAASRRLKALQGVDEDVLFRRLAGFLTRRGFGYDVVRRTVERCWRETAGPETP